jgi:hypothetical protein
MPDQKPWERIAELEQELEALDREALDWLRADLDSDSCYFAANSRYADWCMSDEGAEFIRQLEQSVEVRREWRAEDLDGLAIERGPRGRLSGLAERHIPRVRD